MRLLVFGQTGQVARALARLRPQDQYLSRAEVDLTNPEDCRRAIENSNADVIVNAAAYTNVDRAESDAKTAFLVNADSPTIMAKCAAAKDIPFLHISTDFVFDGSGTNGWQPDDIAAPLNVYGQSKLAGEAGIIEAAGAHVILRTSWVFSVDGGNFVKSMLRLAKTHDQLRVVSDQIGGPTPAADIAAAIVKIATELTKGKCPSGIFHFAGAPDVSWADFARAILAEANQNVTVENIPSAAYPTVAQRPLNSRLDCRKLERDFGIRRPDWRLGLKDVLEAMKDPTR